MDVNYRAILRSRLRSVLSADAVQRMRPSPSRVQKNLSLTGHDAGRLSALARRDGLSQARLLAAALDCYEAEFGAIRIVDEAAK